MDSDLRVRGSLSGNRSEIGLSSILAAKRRCSQVLSAEADLMNARLLNENVLRNDIAHKVVALPLGLSLTPH